MVYKRDLVLEHVIARTRRENFSRLNNNRIQTITSAIQGATILEYAYFLNQLILLKTTFKINSLTLQIANSEVNSNYQVHQQVFVELFHIQNITLYILLGIKLDIFCNRTPIRAGGYIGIRSEIFLFIITLPELYSTHTVNITVQILQAEGHLTMTSPCLEIKKSDHLSTYPLPMLQALDMRSISS